MLEDLNLTSLPIVESVMSGSNIGCIFKFTQRNFTGLSHSSATRWNYYKVCSMVCPM